MARNRKATRRSENEPPTPGDIDQGAAHGPLGARVWVHQKPQPKKRLPEGESPNFNNGGKVADAGRTALKFGRQNMDAHANALVVLRRLAFEKRGKERETEKRGDLDGYLPHTPLHTWATESGAGQRNNPHLPAVLKRRRALLEQMTAPRGGSSSGNGLRRAHALRLRLETEWRLVTGLGLQFGVLDSGLALHGTYGWPVIPAPTLKGLAAAGARVQDADEEQVRRVLGDPRPGRAPAKRGPQGRGGVVFLDALPELPGVDVHQDTITPHQKPYYTSTFPTDDSDDSDRTEAQRNEASGNNDVRPPAEHHNPVPVPFLTISGGLHVDLVGDDLEDLETAAEWLRVAGDELGGGGRTSASYGYFTCDVLKEDVTEESEGETR